MSVTTLATTYLVCMSKVRHYRVPCRLRVNFAENVLFRTEISSGVTDLPATNDRRLGSLSTRNTPMVLDMTRNSIVYELLARSANYLK